MIQQRRSQKRMMQTGLFLTALLGAASLPSQAQTLLSSNLSNATGGTEIATGTDWLTVSFTTDASAYILNSITLLLANTGTGTAELDLYSNGLLSPGTLLGTLVSPGSYSSTLANTTFTTSGFALTPNSTYWAVLHANTGSFDWSFTNDDTGAGVGFADTYGTSGDSGATWFSFTGAPLQASVTATATAVPEPGILAFMAAGGAMGAGMLLRRRALLTGSK